MNTTTHLTNTPGPWITTTAAVILARNPQIPDGPSVEIAQVHTIYDKDGWGQTDRNCDLIAAAPEMLEALRQCITRPTFDSDHSITTEIAAMRRLAAINAIVEAVIRKAEGVAK